MTKPYSAKFLPSFKRFIEKVEEEFNYKIEFNSKQASLFRSFFLFLEKDLEDKFFLKNSSSLMVDFFKKELDASNPTIRIDSHDSTANLIYYKFRTKTFDIIIISQRSGLKKRHSKK